jgi:hypothetical protein
MGKKAETEKRGEHEDCLTLYPVFPSSLADQTFREKEKEIQGN